MEEEKAVFRDVLRKVKNTIGEEDFVFAFSSVVLISLRDGKLVFGVPAEFIRDFILKHKTELDKIGKEVANIQDIEIIISDQVNAGDFFEDIELDTPQEELKESIEISVTPPPKIQTSHNLDMNFSFKNFLVGDSNQFAYSVAQVIAKNPGTAHNPCLFYGDVGLGKTHLLQAIGLEILVHNPRANVVFYTSEEFLQDFIKHLSNNTMKEFKNKTRKADVLLLDDIHFLSGKSRLQEEFYHIFNSLLKDEKQMVFTSDRAVHQISDLEERLQSRFRSNMIADLNPPDVEMAYGIIEQAIARNKERRNASPEAFEISQEVKDFVVERMRFNIRDLLGYISRIVGYQELTKTRVTIDVAKKWATEYQVKRNYQKIATIDVIIESAARYFDVTVSDIKSKRRSRNLTHVRHIAMYLLKNMTKNSLTDIGKVFGVSHVSVSSAINNVSEEMNISPELISEVEDIRLQIQRKKDKA